MNTLNSVTEIKAQTALLTREQQQDVLDFVKALLLARQFSSRPVTKPTSDLAANAVSGEEAAELLRRIIVGETALHLEDASQTWANVGVAGNVSFLADGYRIVIFSDCAELDYVDHMVAPDGRRGDFDSWFAHDEQPLRLLNKLECYALEMKLEEAR